MPLTATTTILPSPPPYTGSINRPAEWNLVWPPGLRAVARRRRGSSGSLACIGSTVKNQVCFAARGKIPLRDFRLQPSGESSS